VYDFHKQKFGYVTFVGHSLKISQLLYVSKYQRTTINYSDV